MEEEIAAANHTGIKECEDIERRKVKVDVEDDESEGLGFEASGGGRKKAFAEHDVGGIADECGHGLLRGVLEAGVREAFEGLLWEAFECVEEVIAAFGGLAVDEGAGDAAVDANLGEGSRYVIALEAIDGKRESGVADVVMIPLDTFCDRGGIGRIAHWAASTG
jgi:hypothetical protein